MITISVKNLMESIQESEAFKMPYMNNGTEYLYNSIYNKLSKNMDVKLSEIDFDAFESGDINFLNDLHIDVFEKNYCASNGIVSTLRVITPTCKVVDYV